MRWYLSSMPDVGARARAKPMHVMAKPTGPICNLDCGYCYFLSKEELYPGDRFRMSDGMLDTYMRRLFESQPGPEVTVAWQGGEPTLMGVDFFRRVVELADSCRRPGQVVHHSIQTNGTLLTDELCELFATNGFLVGISLDGPRELHDANRVDKRANPTFDKVMAGLDLLKRHEVDFNVLCTVNSANQDHPLEVYRFLRDEAGAHHLQFIPIVERTSGSVTTPTDTVTDRSVDPAAWGRFMISIFDEWVVRDVGTVFVQMFDAALAAWMDLPASLCIFAETCGDAVVVEHNGDVYSCDHFVEPTFLLGNIAGSRLDEMVASSAQRAFGAAKRDGLPRQCLECEVLFACRGECPKNRFATTPGGDPDLNYLCSGYKAFFGHIDVPMRLMADLLRQGSTAAGIMAIFATAGRNEPCPCGSGLKAKRCHRP